VLNLALEGIIVGNQQELVEPGCFLGLEDGIGQLVPALSVDAVGGLVENAKFQSAEFFDHGQRHGQSQFGLLAAGKHREAPLSRCDAQAIAIRIPLELDGVGVDLVVNALCPGGDPIAQMLREVL